MRKKQALLKQEDKYPCLSHNLYGIVLVSFSVRPLTVPAFDLDNEYVDFFHIF